MPSLAKETITLVPKVVLRKAKELFVRKLYSPALELLTENSIQFDVYELENKMEIRFPEKKRRIYPFDKNRKR